MFTLVFPLGLRAMEEEEEVNEAIVSVILMQEEAGILMNLAGETSDDELTELDKRSNEKHYLAAELTVLYKRIRDHFYH